MAARQLDSKDSEGALFSLVCFVHLMMPLPDYCCAFGCSNRRANCPGVSFHHFPRDEPLRSQWIHAVGRDTRKDFSVTKNAVVCSDHFEKDNFWPSVTGPDDGSGFTVTKRRLKPYSVPTIFSFRSEPKHRPSPADRLALAEERQKQQLLRKSLPVYGPPTLAEHLFQQLAEYELPLREHELQIKELKKPN